MSSPSGSATITSETKKDAHSAKKLFLAAPREYKRKLSKKGKDTQANGPQQDTKPESAGGKALKSDILSEKPVASDMAAENGAANGSHPGVSVGQDPDQAVPAATGHGNAAAKDSDGGHSAEQSASSTGGDRDTQKEKASLSTTVTGTGTTLKHKKDKTSETVNSGTIVEKPTSKQSVKKERASRKKKKSFWSKLASAVFNCTWPSDPPHAVDIDEGASGVSDPSSSAIGLKEISAPLRDKEGLVIEEAAPLTTSGPSNEPSGPTSTDAESPASPPNLTIPPIEDAAIVVPPSPTKHVPPEDMAGGLTSAAVQPPGSTGREAGEDSDESSFAEQDEDQKMDEEDEEERLIMNGGAGIPIGPDGVPRPLLPPIAPQHAGRKCLVLDLDETLLHSSFKSIQHADYVVPVEIEYHWHNVYCIKRPGVDNFLKKMGEIYEVVVFTASLSKYADPVLDKLDIHNVVTHRLFRESCYNHKGNYVKDLSQLGRPMADTIILDNSPASYIFHPNNAVPVSSWFNDPHDTELTDLVPFLSDLGTVDDVRGVLDGGL